MTEPDSWRRSGGNDIAGLQAHKTAQVTDNLLNAKDHGAGIAILIALTVHFQPEIQLLGIGNLICGHQPWTNRAKGIATLAFIPRTAPLNLPFALGNIVDYTISGHVLHGILLADIASTLSNNDPQFNFPVGLGGLARD